MDRGLKGKVVLITGGGGGIARGIERAFAAEGTKFILTDLFPGGMAEAKEELEREFGAEVFTYLANGSVESEVKEAVDAGAAHFGGQIDVLINNAQASASGLTLIEHTEEDFDLAVRSGLYATFFYMKHCYPYLKKTAGSVINFASGAGIGGNPGQSSYAAAKEGIRGMSRVAASEWGEDDINVNIVCPLVMTKILEEWRDNNPEMYEKNIKGIPLGRFGDAEKDVGRVCVFLASDDASFVTGDTIIVQGGSGMKP
ncbi:SDR family NAD(P)-dependent oxidoreductase [Arabiibacter massiliensis]|uniref:SDR family NAD(P)-dependent oxidoreductase n=1 Tax=Arabiibacter massiliensis TaxID=1870985 RepID=UPI0009BAD907|nr:SDR family NAD(P)-dependent oxidoreductase [Arabiibacter massiliensis]